ncbi:FMN-binding protein [Caldimonas brevitalea]|uniref:FMN-binding protein n=1 Tax=Caldimonas brevitalea TaxID=413882 RepID=A0A0G3BQI6_9BURK|nr:FMN-binding protein [Caldimonas brevitalea]AKJ29636.1 FMN-binding protein [Caldimonas brevitalea]
MSRRDWSWFLVPTAALVSPVYATDYLSVPQAQKLLFPQAQAFLEQPLKLSAEQRDRVKAVSGLRQRWDEQKVWRAEKDGRLQGWFIQDDVIGKHEFITYAVAISPQGEVLGVEILSYRETHGGQVREPQWRKHFAGKTLADPLKLDQDVPNISGATLSCRNITDGVKRLLTLHQLYLSSHG